MPAYLGFDAIQFCVLIHRHCLVKKFQALPVIMRKNLKKMFINKSLHKNRFLLLVSMICFGILFSSELMSQTIVTGTIKSEEGKILQSANVLLLAAADSSLVKGTVSNPLGKYSFENIKTGTYLLKATFTGMDQAFSNAFKIEPGVKEISIADLYLKNLNVQLKNVTVAVKKPMFEQKNDRMVINVKNSVTNAGGSALDVLEKSPGITVNRQNNSIAINGKNGVMVMINGKINYMPMEAVVQLMSATSADNIEKIEVITTPPSKYDAAGNAGYINIVLINNPYKGISGSYFIDGGYGKKELGGAGINFNYRSSKINLYGNYSSRYVHYIQPASGFTQFTKGGDIVSITSFSDRDAISKVQNIRTGLDYQLDSSTIIGVLVGGYNSRWEMTAKNGSTISKNHLVDTIISTIDTEVNHWDNLLTNLNFQHTFKPGKTLYLDANYIYYKDNNPNTYSNTYFNNAKRVFASSGL